MASGAGGADVPRLRADAGGRDPHDALVIVPRICGICSVSQSVAAARGAPMRRRGQPPPNGDARHQPDAGLREPGRPPDALLPVLHARLHAAGVRRTRLVRARRSGVSRRWPASTRAAVAARQRWFEIMGTLGGKWPHTRASSPAAARARWRRLNGCGCSPRCASSAPSSSDHLRRAARRSGALADRAARCWPGARRPLRGDLRLFLTIADTGLDWLGRGPGLALSPRRLPPRFAIVPPAGWVGTTHAAGVDLDARSRDDGDVSHAWLAGAAAASARRPTEPAARQARRLHLEQGAAPGRPGGRDRRHRRASWRAAIRSSAMPCCPRARTCATRVLARLLEVARAADDGTGAAALARASLLPARPSALPMARASAWWKGARRARPLAAHRARPASRTTRSSRRRAGTFAARCRRHARRAGGRAGRGTGAARRGHAGGRAARRAILRPVHGLHGALMRNLRGPSHPPGPARIPSGDRPTAGRGAVADSSGRLHGPSQIEGMDEAAWVDVIGKMEEVYSSWCATRSRWRRRTPSSSNRSSSSSACSPR